MRYFKNYKIVMTMLCSLWIVTGCSANIIDPDEYIKSAYPEYEQLTKIEDPSEQIILLKSQDTYELVRFKKRGTSYTYNGGYITNAPFGLTTTKVKDRLYILIFLDNTVVKANQFTIRLKSSNKEEYLTLNCPNLLKQGDYLIKTYELRIEYDEVKPIKFYDKEGKFISEERIPDL